MKFYGVTIQKKVTEQYFPVVLCIMLYTVVLTFESGDEMLQCNDRQNYKILPGVIPLGSQDVLQFEQFFLQTALRSHNH